MSDWMIVGVVYGALTWALFGYGVGRPKSRAGLGFFLGLVGGPLGVAAIFAMAREETPEERAAAAEVEHQASLARSREAQARNRQP